MLFGIVIILNAHDGFWADYTEKCFKDFPDTWKETNEDLFCEIKVINSTE